MKGNFSSGLIIILPIVLTVMIINFVINLVTHPFLEMTRNALMKSNFFHPFFNFFNHYSLFTAFSKIFILTTLFALIVLAGFLGRLFLIEFLLRQGEKIFHQLPFINKIYKTCQDVVHSLFSSSSQKFSQVVLVPFPHPGSLCIGLVSSESITLKKENNEIEMLTSVFVPGAPNPSVGFMLLFKSEQLIHISMKVEEAMKCILSCGMVIPHFEIKNHH